MKAFNLLVKIAAFVLILYVILQQKDDYYKELRGTAAETPATAIEEQKPVETPPANVD